MKTNNKEDSVDWNNIFILDEFSTYIRSCDINDFSLLSRFIRNKLKPKLFHKTTISIEHIVCIYDVKIKCDKEIVDILHHFESLKEHSFLYDGEEWEEMLQNISDFLVLKQLVQEELKGIGNFIRNFSVKQLYSSFYFICPLLLDLTSLTRLHLYACTFPLLTMLRIGEHMKNLKILSLHTVRFVGLIKQELSPEDSYLPPNLEDLSIIYCRVYRVHSVPNILSLRQNCKGYNCNDIDRSQAIKIPSLKKLTLIFGAYIEIIDKLLKSNLQVKELATRCYNMTQEVYDLVSICNRLTDLTITCLESFPYISEYKNLIFPKFNYIKNLKLCFFAANGTDVNHSQCITKHFTSLTHLTLFIGIYGLKNFRLNEFLRVNLQFNNTIDKLTLENRYYEYFKEKDYFEYSELRLDFSNFTNIKCLIIDIDIIPLSNIDFDNTPEKLKIIKIGTLFQSLHRKFIEENPNKLKKWKINFKGIFTYFTR
ncbi:hypothetical protein CONCODRAFT_13926 [Conidiobolus coronatus NRRL 28638]|uniref:F-box domain-containing protein n=1 Tax=Conidiobolus coronatus (strain ATCC 28846 / CBS 209.66 / NRRL 28638) TaxID=796925 RepID=A0A137NPW8_CONC2|nr:hypothetical protein CONCODRAFT_13926 [Conidiobolus coronatus NRRL 28638]|eukprot:KXN64787.1 hypothetical protein CONCODRAFT_13926 [Conidiobolus coronatus NRRL 28638]